VSTRFHPGPAYFAAEEELRDNPEQWQVLESDGNCAVLAGPGSGKTKCLTLKIAGLLAGEIAPPQKVACITYSTECVRELRRRLNTLGVRTRDLYVGTVHGFCFQHIVRPFAQLASVPLAYPIRVASEAEQETHFARVAQRLRGGGAAQVFGTRVQRYRRTMLDRNADAWRAQDPELAELAEAYEQSLRGEGLVDFEDMVLIAQQLVREHEWVRAALAARFPVVAVDEYQDLGPALHRIVVDLAELAAVRVIAVGDPDQSIYGFTGSEPALLEELAERNSFTSVRLRLNYRATQSLVDVSEAALGADRGYRARSKATGIVQEHYCPEGLADQARHICREIIPAALGRDSNRQLGDIAVLYTDKNVGSVMADASTDAGLSYQRIDRGAPYPKTPFTRWVEACAAWCAGGWHVAEPRLAELTREWQSFGPDWLSDAQRQRRTLELVEFLSSHTARDPLLLDWLRGFYTACLQDGLDAGGLRAGEVDALKRLAKAAMPGNPMEGILLSRFAGNRGSPDHLNLVTLFSAKGLEFDVVVIMGLDEGVFPNWNEKTPRAIAEARRKFYVAFTRAKREVHLTYSGFNENRYGRRFENGPSRFLLEVRERLQAPR
jgi:DNA helicase-2/ATP-dependent DNA helicase PcrA